MIFFLFLGRERVRRDEMEKTNDFMKTGKVFPLLMSMSVPMMISMLIQSLYNIVDSIYVSRLGTDALTAVSLAYPLQNVVTSVAVGIGVDQFCHSHSPGRREKGKGESGGDNWNGTDSDSLHLVCASWYLCDKAVSCYVYEK